MPTDQIQSFVEIVDNGLVIRIVDLVNRNCEAEFDYRHNQCLTASSTAYSIVMTLATENTNLPLQ